MRSTWFPSSVVKILLIGVFSVLVLLLVATNVLAESVPSMCPYSWERTLKVGSTGEDVMKLQQFLNGNADTMIAASGMGSAGNETTTFGALTKQAVIKFQEKYAADILTPNNLSSGTGLAGAATRAKLNALCSAPAATTLSASQTAGAAAATMSVDVLTVGDPGQPASSLAPHDASPLFLSFTLTAGSKDVTVSAVTVDRIGFGADGAFLNFALFDEQGLQIGNVASPNAQHRITFRKPFTVPANTSHAFDVYANMASDLSSYTGQMPNLQLVALSASSPVEGPLPLRGAPQTINNSLTVGGATGLRSQYDPGVALTRYVGEAGVRFSGIRITANSPEDLTLSSIIWIQSGSAGPGDYDNITTVADGKTYPTFVNPYSSKEYVTLIDPGIVIKKGNSIDVYVRGDIKTTGANRTIQFDIRDNTDDVILSGNLYGLGVAIIPGGNTATAGNSVFLTSDGTTAGTALVPFYAGPVITISAGAFTTIGK